MPDPSELLAVAKLLIDETIHPASDAQCRRAISTAYYAVFHKILGTAASRFVGAGQEASGAYAIIYRGFDHGKVKDVCTKLIRPRLSETLKRQLGRSSISQDMQDFSRIFPDIQEARHDADYDPTVSFSVADVLTLIESAEAAMAAFDRAPAGEQGDVLALMLVKPRA